MFTFDLYLTLYGFCNIMETESEDTEDEWEEEVILLVELTGLPNSGETIKTCKDTCAILGLDSSEPVLQLDKYLFKGSYEDILGTAMIFEPGKGKKLSYVCKTNKKLTMTRVVLKNKEQTSVEHPPQETMDISEE